MTNDSSNSQLLHKQSDKLSELNSSTLSSTVSGDSNSEAEHEHTSQSDCVLSKTTSKQIEVVPTKSEERKRIRCKACNENSDVVKRFFYRGRIPPICTGTEARTGTIATHLRSETHKESVKLNRIKGLSSSEKNTSNTLIQDSKCTNTPSRQSNRVVTSEIAHTFDYNNPFEEYDASVFDLQYVTPASHQQLLKIIVLADLPRFKEEIDDCLAASFCCDASMDCTKKDNEFMLL
ncbi:Hypothetical predicted protein [Paramuricea clavata]|uniref:Uncharacterized protein n=1 Tax=Paramuricea clavata TaxID=317549 RepID=A0A6S7GQ59_PARCT|nr:Hypothetical predicted protein [Paramuricea clavata]